MPRLRKTVLLRAFACVMTAGVTVISAPAMGVEPWPPETPPQVVLPPDQTPVPKKQAPPAVVPAQPKVPAAAEPKAPPPVVAPVAEPVAEPVSAPAPSSDTLVVSVRPEERPPGGVVFGSKDGQFFLRTAHDELVLLPTARLELDARSVMAPDRYASENVASLGRARLDLSGWLYSKVYFNLAADFAAGPSLRHADNFIAVAPWGDRAILQVGQFDAPFTLENRTSDRYLDFIDRGVAVRAFAISENKDQGLMVHGTNPERNFYYSAGVFNGEGPEVTGVDGRFDVMLRAWVAPFSFRDPDALHNITLGGSFWTGDRSVGPVYAGQTTQGGFATLDPSVWWTMGQTSPIVVREQGRLSAIAVELNAPFTHRFGLRYEWIGKRQPFSAFDVTNAGHPTIVSSLNLSGWATYAEVWGWVLGDDRMLGVPAAPGLELPLRYRDLEAEGRARSGLMLAARVDYIDEKMTPEPVARLVGLGAASAGTIKLTALTVGATCWYTRRARVSVNYVFNHLDGTTPYILGLDGRNEHEILFRTALAL
jgi:Phosphate-selective porin O and P